MIGVRTIGADSHVLGRSRDIWDALCAYVHTRSSVQAWADYENERGRPSPGEGATRRGPGGGCVRAASRRYSLVVHGGACLRAVQHPIHVRLMGDARSITIARSAVIFVDGRAA